MKVAAASSSSQNAIITVRRSPGGSLLASGTAAAVSSHRSPGTVMGVGRLRSDRSVRRTPRSAMSTVAITDRLCHLFPAAQPASHAYCPPALAPPRPTTHRSAIATPPVPRKRDADVRPTRRSGERSVRRYVHGPLRGSAGWGARGHGRGAARQVRVGVRHGTVLGLTYRSDNHPGQPRAQIRRPSPERSTIRIRHWFVVLASTR